MSLIFVDLDGVFCDFDAGVKSLTGKYPKELQYYELYGSIIANKDFWSTLPVIPNSLKLWEYLKQSSVTPIILTATMSDPLCTPGKIKWVEDNLGKGISTICTKRRFKRNFANQSYYLIDDNRHNIEEWQENGGLGIHHTNTETTIQILKRLKI